MADETTLLIDGDVLAFIAAAAVQNIHEDRFGFVQPFANRHEGEAVLDNLVLGLELSLGATHFRIALTDPKENWRRGVYADYKANRKAVPLPLLLGRLKDYLRERWGAFHWDGLEADDVLGILSTEPQTYPGKRILVGRDKDFLTIAGSYHCLRSVDVAGKPFVRDVTPWEATRFHLFQTLTGDATDGYPGCPGMGKTRAEAFLQSPTRLVPSKSVKTRGVNKGDETVKWTAEPTNDLWAGIVSHYRKAGQGEAEALVTARLANILHHDQYDRDTGAITLWTPDRIVLG